MDCICCKLNTNWKNIFKFIIYLFSLGALVAFFLWIFPKVLWLSQIRMSDFISIVAAISSLLLVIAAFLQIKHSNTTIQIMKENSSKQLMAYGLINGVKFDSDVELLLYCYNGGTTPAFNCTTHTNIEPIPVNQFLKEDFEFPYYNSNTTRSVFMMSPLKEVVTTTNFDKKYYEMLNSRTHKLLIYGDVTYTDVYDKINKTIFCFELEMIDDKQVCKVFHKHNEFNSNIKVKT